MAIKAVKRPEGKTIGLNTSHILTVEEADKENSEVTLVGGKKLLVAESMLSLIHKLNIGG